MTQLKTEGKLWPEVEEESNFLPRELQLYLSTILHKQSSETQVSNNMQPEIIDHHTQAGQERLSELLSTCREGNATFDMHQYDASCEELIEFATWMQTVPETSEEVLNHMISVLQQFVPEVSSHDLGVLLNSTNLVEDLVVMAQEARELGKSRKQIEQDSRWIWFPQDKLLTKMIGREAYYLLTVKSRALGLIPFSALDKLRNLKIRCAGASAVVHLLDLLASLGAEDMQWWDAGKTAPSNIGRLGRVGAVKYLGKSKARSLQQELLAAYPYANFLGSQGKVVMDEDSYESPEDISYELFVDDADLVIEVIDSAQGKIDLRLHVKQNSGKTRVVYLADVNDAFVRLEDTRSENHFGQGLPEAHFRELSKQFAELRETEPSQKRDQQLAFLNLQAVVHMLYKQFPPEHQLQFLYIIGGLTPFWAQTAISARESAAVGSRLILESLLELHESTDKTYTSETISHSFRTELSEQQIRTLQQIMSSVFKLPLDLYEA